MPRWSEFGEQVNRLVYTLAGCKFHGNVDSANRFLAERIHYSEASVRAMRQGRFRPQDDRALETLVEIGASEAGLDHVWACRLLGQGQHPAPKAVLQRIYASPLAETVACSPDPYTWRDTFAWRILGGSLGGLVALLIWSFAISRLYPAPHELPVLLEAIWGLLVGSGLAGGIAWTDALVAHAQGTPRAQFALPYLALPLGGLGGALLWNLLVAPLFSSAAPGRVSSTWRETMVYGVVYGLAFGAATLLIAQRHRAPRLQPFRMMLSFALMPGSLALVGLLLATAQPAFADQEDIDLMVGILLRLGLLLPVAAFFPPLQLRGSAKIKPA